MGRRRVSGFFTVVNGIFAEHRYATEAFDRKSNLFAGRNNMATVLEVPTPCWVPAG